jgi:hypothetical protein
MRHACRHEHKLQEWGWREHDGQTYGLQFVGDAANRAVRAGGGWVDIACV